MIKAQKPNAVAAARKPMINAQKLNRLVTIQQATETRDAFGQAVPVWSTFAQVYAEIKPLSGRERFLSAATDAESNYRARIRFMDGITPKMRISFDNKFFNITYIADDGFRRELLLDLVEGLISA